MGQTLADHSRGHAAGPHIRARVDFLAAHLRVRLPGPDFKSAMTRVMFSECMNCIFNR
jgi:hypothetical protein